MMLKLRSWCLRSDFPQFPEPRKRARQFRNGTPVKVQSTLSVPIPRTVPAEPTTSSVGRRSRPNLSSSHPANPDTPVSAADTPFIVLSTSEGVSLEITSGGTLSLRERTGHDATAPRLVASANLRLPPDCTSHQPVVVERKHDADGNLVQAVLQWGLVEAPLAELTISAANMVPQSRDGSTKPWCNSLSRGFVLDYQVARSAGTAAEVAIDLRPSGHWFGGGHFIRQLWPLNSAAIEVGPWLAFDNGPTGQNNLLGPHWMTSNGLLVAVDPDTPYLHIGFNAPAMEKAKQRRWGVGIQNATRELLPLTLGHARVARSGCDGLLRVQAHRSYKDSAIDHPLREWESSVSTFEENSVDGSTDAAADTMSVRVALCATSNAFEAVQMALGTHTPPRQVPSRDVIKAPIWTTWARFKTRVDQAKVLQYAQEIADRGLQRSVMEIDDRWQTAYGDLAFDAKKFPDAVGMIDRLHDLGFKVTAWVHPFVEEKSAAYREGAARGFFVGCDPVPMGAWGKLREAIGSRAPPIVPIAPGGSAPGFFAWWNTPPVAALDVTNPEAVDWFVTRLRALQEATGLDGFKFDAGEPCFLPRRPQTHAPMGTPADYTRLYVQRVAGPFAGGVSEVRTGHLTQDVAVLCRMGDRFSTWDAGNGLRSLIPTLLTSGLLGYPFCLPDMVGGNAYFGRAPDSELMVRWAQANALMPAMQFSIAPWDLGKEAESLVASVLELRHRLEGQLLSLADEAAHTLMPICRPLWMLAPGDQQTYEVQDQFALGNDVIVAPVVHRGARRRDIYLTAGAWRDMHDGAFVEGGRWLHDVPTPLDKLPVFVREGTPGVQF
jgi:myogenesis-regulating glycosidase